MIKTIHLKKNFGEKQVLKDINLSIEPGKITSIVGRNGAGKSTILALIMGYKLSSGGEIEKDCVSVMPDADNLFRDMRGLDFLEFIAKLKKASITKPEIEALADQLFLKKEDLQKKLKSYSFGMKKKISFLQALIGDFDTYIFDEPTSGVDVETELIMMNQITALKDKGKAILLTSHNMEEVEQYSDYVYILDGGVVTSEGTVDELTKNKGLLENFVIMFEPLEREKMDLFLKKQGISEVQYNNELLILFRLTSDNVHGIVQDMLEAHLTIRGFYPEKKALREVVFEDVESKERT